MFLETLNKFIFFFHQPETRTECVRVLYQVKYLNLLKLLANRKMTMIIMINDTFKNLLRDFFASSFDPSEHVVDLDEMTGA